MSIKDYDVTLGGVKYIPESEIAKARAEVLAACIARLQEQGKIYRSEPVASGAYYVAAALVAAIEPAAKALEELLEEARREARLAEHNEVCQVCCDDGAALCRRRGSLEKARAT